VNEVAVPPYDFEQILGVRFFNGPVDQAVEYISRTRGYVVVPAAPALTNIRRDPEYRRALVRSDLAIADSGLMVVLWRVLRGRKITRISGLRYLRSLLGTPGLRKLGSVFLVVPSETAREKALLWLRRQSFEISEHQCYVAPLYGKDVSDTRLLSLLNNDAPSHVIVGIGGGAQEKLGHYLREQLEVRPAIHCVGAAIGFLTGDQRPIPMWADRFFLGWLFRLVARPRVFIPRLWRAWPLPWMIWKYGERPPPLALD
jgi:exopolysaccharide biosynthesis WecB/TagA/CpsF family protein